MTDETDRYNIDKITEVEKEELKVIDKLDTKEKIYKGLLIGLCVIALVISAMFIPKAEIIIPVLSLIIGLLFKSNSLNDFYPHNNRKQNDIDE